MQNERHYQSLSTNSIVRSTASSPAIRALRLKRTVKAEPQPVGRLRSDGPSSWPPSCGAVNGQCINWLTKERTLQWPTLRDMSLYPFFPPWNYKNGFTPPSRYTYVILRLFHMQERVQPFCNTRVVYAECSGFSTRLRSMVLGIRRCWNGFTEIFNWHILTIYPSLQYAT